MYGIKRRDSESLVQKHPWEIKDAPVLQMLPSKTQCVSSIGRVVLLRDAISLTHCRSMFLLQSKWTLREIYQLSTKFTLWYMLLDS